MRLKLLALSLALLSLAAASKPNPVDYSLTPELDGDALKSLAVQVRYTLPPDGVSDFAWAQGWESEHALWKWSRDLKVEGAASVEQPSDGVWRIHGPPGAPVTVRYRVVSAYDHDPTADDSAQPKPIIRPTWFYSTGYALFGVPRERLNDPARFHWNGAASGFRFASDLDHLVFVPGAVGDIRQSILLGERDLLTSGNLEGRDRIRVAAIRGNYAFALSDFDTLARRIIHEERAFFGEDDQAPFLVAVSPIAPGKGVQQFFSGTGLGDSFALWLDGHADLDQMRWLIAHEYFHTWNALKLGGQGRLPTTAPITWFSEGFTDYYARALMVRAGIIPPASFVALWNTTLRNYAASQVRTASNSRIATDFQTNPQVADLAYQRGALLAARWNRRLREETKGRVGLDDIILAQYAWVKSHPAASGSTSSESAPEIFARLARTRFGVDLGPDIRRFVDNGEVVALEPDTFGPCVQIRNSMRPAFDRGFDAEATIKADNVVVGVKPNSAAFVAGLRDGMKILSRDSGEPGNSEVPYALRVDDHGTTRVVRYQPIGSGMTSRQELSLTAAGSSPSCSRTLSGV